jgi:hypothetical protein
MRVRLYLPPKPCPAEPVRTSKSQPKMRPIQNRKKGQDGLYRGTAKKKNSKRVKRYTIPIPADNFLSIGIRRKMARSVCSGLASHQQHGPILAILEYPIVLLLRGPPVL